MARYVNLDKIEAQLMQMYKCVPFAVKRIFDEAEVEEVITVEEHENKVRDLEWTIEWLMDDIVMLQEE